MPRRKSKPTKGKISRAVRAALERVKLGIARDWETHYGGDHYYVDKVELPPDPWAAVDAIVKREAEPTGPEWFTPRQFADRYHVSLNRAHEVCNRLAKEGKLRRWKGTSLTTHKTATKYAPA